MGKLWIAFAAAAALLLTGVALAQPTNDCTPPRRCTYIALVAVGGGTPINGGETPAAVIVNGGFEQGQAAWTEQTALTRTLIVNRPPAGIRPRTGEYIAWLGAAPNSTSLIVQRFSVPPTTPFLGYWYWLNSKDDDCSFVDSDVAEVLVDPTLDGDYADAVPLLNNRYRLCDNNNTLDWKKNSADLRPYAGQTIDLIFRIRLDAARDSNIYIDDVGLQARPSAAE
jgi:hypothetical protein